jgi:hypothetical protein
MIEGLDMFSLDVLHLKNGEELILELNDSSMGLMFDHEKEDNSYIKELVLNKMNNHFIKKDEKKEEKKDDKKIEEEKKENIENNTSLINEKKE